MKHRETDRRGIAGPAGIPLSGKISSYVFESAIRPYLGAPRGDVLVGPCHGVDFGVIDMGNGHVLALTTDPFFVMPELGWERAAWYAVHIVASDAATSGLAPVYCTVDLNLPNDFTDCDLAALWQAVHAVCSELGIAVVTGHTGRYDGCSFPMLGAATVMATGGAESYVTPAMAKPGDLVLLTKGAGIETTAMFGVMFPDRIREQCGHRTARLAEAMFWEMTVVPDARAAASAGVRDGGVTAMHDATERGVWNGLREIADASAAGMVLEESAIIVRPETRAVCELFDIDPLTTSSEGTLLLTCRPHAIGNVVARLEDAGIASSILGEVTPEDEGVRVWRDGRAFPLSVPPVDPFWPAFRAALQEDGP